MYLNEGNSIILELTAINLYVITNDNNFLILAINSNNDECFWCCLNKIQLYQQNNKIK
jgi:hypothetical protein